MCVVSIACISYNDAYAKLIRQISTSSKFHCIIKEITNKYNKLYYYVHGVRRLVCRYEPLDDVCVVSIFRVLFINKIFSSGQIY